MDTGAWSCIGARRRKERGEETDQKSAARKISDSGSAAEIFLPRHGARCGGGGCGVFAGSAEVGSRRFNHPTERRHFHFTSAFKFWHHPAWPSVNGTNGGFV